MKEDILYHLGLTTSNDDLEIMFGDVKVSKNASIEICYARNYLVLGNNETDFGRGG